jgi:hypothetical protein
LKAIVHIGTEKTGTSSIQSFLYKNRRMLERHGYHFLQSAGKTNNWMLPAFCSEENRFNDFYRHQSVETDQQLEKFSKKFLGEFESELRLVKNNVHTIIISSEHFHSRLRSDEEMRNVQQFLSKYFDEVKILCYLREQATTCASWYSTSMKSGKTYSFHEFVRRCKPESYYFNYFNLLTNWERYFGFESLDVALFSPDRFLNGDLLDDFTVRIDPALVGKLDKAFRAANVSLSPMGQALNRALNIALPLGNEGADLSEVRNKCKEIIAQRLAGKGQQIDLAGRAAIFDSFIDSNEKLRERYFPTYKTLFFPPVEEDLVENKLDESFLEVLNTIFKVLRKHGKESIGPEEYTNVWSAIATCISDVVSVKEGVKQGGTEVVLTEEDGRMIKKAAMYSEWADPKSAVRLMSLASEVYPELPEDNYKLQAYKEKLEEEPRTEFLMTYNGDLDIESGSEEEREMAVKFGAWVMSLEVPTGPNPVTRLCATSVLISADDVKINYSPPLNGYTIFRAKSMEEAISIAKKSPHIEAGGYVEIFELKQLWDFEQREVLGLQKMKQ